MSKRSKKEFYLHEAQPVYFFWNFFIYGTGIGLKTKNLDPDPYLGLDPDLYKEKMLEPDPYIRNTETKH